MAKGVYMFVTFVTVDDEAKSPLRGLPVLVTEEQQKTIVESSEFGARMSSYILACLEEHWPGWVPSRDTARLAIVKIDDGQAYEDIVRGVGDLEVRHGRDIVLDITALEIGAFAPTVSTVQH